MKKIIIQENQRGLLFRNGVFVKVLKPGKYHAVGGRSIAVSALDGEIKSEACSPELLLRNDTFRKETVSVEVKDGEIALHYLNGRIKTFLQAGVHVFWCDAGEHTFTHADITTPEIPSDFPPDLIERLPQGSYLRFDVEEHHKGLLFYNNRFVRVLEAGRHYFWKCPTSVGVQWVDTRRTQMDLSGQELLTRDRVTLRINFVLHYRITDCIRVLTEIDDYAQQLYVAAQLALREYVGRYKLDELLESRDELSDFVMQCLKARETELCVEILAAGVKDVILPGEIREIMNTVLVAEKRAQANVITRREEVASTRSLLNTAKLMEENQTLYKLKELEYVERICENVGNISLNGNGNLLSQLTQVLNGSKA